MYQSKFPKLALKDYDFLSFVTSQEKCIDKNYEKLVDPKSMSGERWRHLEPVGTTLGTMVLVKKCVSGCPPFRPILSALQTPTYKLAKYLVSILEL